MIAGFRSIPLIRGCFLLPRERNKNFTTFTLTLFFVASDECFVFLVARNNENPHKKCYRKRCEIFLRRLEILAFSSATVHLHLIIYEHKQINWSHLFPKVRIEFEAIFTPNLTATKANIFNFFLLILIEISLNDNESHLELPLALAILKKRLPLDKQTAIIIAWI